MRDAPDPTPAPENEHETMSDHDMQGMQHEGTHMGVSSPSFVHTIEHHAADGTSVEPDSTPIPMLMFMKNDWSLMLHGVAFLNYIQQTGPRGADKVFSTNWVMGMAQRSFGS